MNWDTLEADATRLITRHYTPGRGGHTIRHVTLHHMAMIGGLDECWNVWQTREASAHYTVDPTGVIGQAVWDRDTAWANANQLSNQQTIAIEHSNSDGPAEDWPISEATLEAGAHLVAALCHHYDLGRPESGNNVRFHNSESGGITECPYHLRPGQKYHDAYLARAQYWYDHPESEPSIMTDEDRALLRETRDLCRIIRDQLTGPGDGYPGWPQTGGRTLVDTVAAIAEIEGVPHTKDTK